MPKKKGAPASPFVPEEEQPYPIPENWCWTTVDKVAMVITGGTPSKKNPEYYGDKFPFFKPTDLDAGRHVFTASEYLSERGKSIVRIIPSKSTAVCCIGSIGKSGYLEIEGTTNQQINSAIPKFNSLYLFYLMNTDVFINQLWSKSSATTISIVNKSKMESCYFPLAPLLEQHRIVSRIESLFSKLDEAKEKAQAVVDGELAWMADSGQPLVRELYRKMATQGLRPRTLVDYTRRPFVYAPGNVRVTLDYDIRTGLGSTDFLNPDCVTIPAGEPVTLLEVKWDAFLPSVIRDAVQLTGRQTGAFSKYAAARIYG